MLVDGSALEWRWSPLRSLIGFGFAADWDVAGAGTELAGRAVLRRHSTVVDEARGSAGGSLLAIVAPTLPFLCDIPMQITLDRAAIGGDDQGVQGEIRGSAGSCVAKAGGVTTIVPPLILSLRAVGNVSEIKLVPIGERRRTLAEGSLARDGRLLVRVTPDGAKVLPFASPPGGITIETTL